MRPGSPLWDRVRHYSALALAVALAMVLTRAVGPFVGDRGAIVLYGAAMFAVGFIDGAGAF